MKNIWLVISITLLVALSTSVMTSVYTNRYLDNYLASLNVEIPLEDRFVQGPRALPGTYEEALQRIDDIREVSLAYLAEYEEADNVDDLVFLNDLIVGVAITSDGWLYYPLNLVNIENYSVIKNDSVYEIVESVIVDGGTLVKAEGLSLEPVGFAKTRDFISGNQFLEVGSDFVRLNSLLRSDIANNTGQPFPDNASVVWEAVSDFEEPALLFDTAGQFVGVSLADNVALPIHALISDIQAVLSEGEVSSLTFGTNGVFLTNAVNHKEGWPKIGYYVVSARTETSFEAGDIILSIDGALIAEPDDFTGLLDSYDLGEEISVRVWRDGEILELTSIVLD